MKKCIKCKLDKIESDFGICKSRKDGLQKQCKKCAKDYRDANKAKVKIANKLYREANKDKAAQYSKDYYKEYQDEFIELARERYLKNKDDLLEKAKIYYIDNKVEINIKKAEYIRQRLKADPLYKLKMNIRTLIKNSIKGRGVKKNTKTANILGCSFQEFKDYLESKFTPEMNWDNQGSYWHMDHIKPISLGQTEQEVIELNHYTNFQPLEKFANLTKSNKYTF